MLTARISSCRLGPSLTTRVLSTTSEYKVPGTAEYFEKQEKLGRPLSPHLTIYKPQLTSMLSITHRATGAGYGVLLYGFAVLTTTSKGFSHWVNLAESYAPGQGLMIAIKSVVVLPLVYHTVNGFRHLFWDIGKNLKIDQVYSTGKITVALSLLISLAMALAL